MNRISFFISLLFFFISSQSLVAQPIPEITSEELKTHLYFLASDELKGRYPGTPEDSITAHYILQQFTEAGLEPFAGGLQSFKIVTGMQAGNNNKARLNQKPLEPKKDYYPLSISENGSLSASVVFGGWGFSIENDTLSWNSYKEIDASGKWVLLMQGVPDNLQNNNLFEPHTDDSYKARIAKENGAAGIILFSNTDDTRFQKLDKRDYGAGVSALQLSEEKALELLQTSKAFNENTLQDLLKGREPISFPLEAEFSATIEINKTFAQTYNVAAIVKAHGPLQDEYIVLGAHYDHLGMGGEGSSSRQKDTVAVHFGADDNASGTAALMEIAEKFAANADKLTRSVVFVAFGAEEKGLLGSKFFVDSADFDISNIKAMANMDMVGRFSNKQMIQIGGTGTATEIPDILISMQKDSFPALALNEAGFGPSDHAAFYGKDIPVFFFSTGGHSEYHTPADTPDKIDYKGLKTVSDFVYNVVYDLSTREQNLTFTEAGSKTRSTGRTNLKVTLGIMPDFASQADKGLGVDFVSPGKPAEVGGMKKGDMIIGINGNEIKNIRDYMFQLSKLEAGERITVTVLRDGAEETLIVQL